MRKATVSGQTREAPSQSWWLGMDRAAFTKEIATRFTVNRGAGGISAYQPWPGTRTRQGHETAGLWSNTAHE